MKKGYLVIEQVRPDAVQRVRILAGRKQFLRRYVRRSGLERFFPVDDRERLAHLFFLLVQARQEGADLLLDKGQRMSPRR